MQLSVVVPTYDEREAVPALVSALDAALEGVAWELILVDDRSPDGTWEVIQAIAAADPRVRGILRDGPPSLAGAVIDGVREASAPRFAVMDADLQHDPGVLLAMVAHLDDPQIDLVVASRFVPGGDAPGLVQSRLYLSVVGIAVVHLLTGVRLADPFSGFFAGRTADFVQRAPRLTGVGFKVLLDLVMAWGSPPRVLELPARLHERAVGSSKFGLRTVWDLLVAVARQRLRRW